MYRDILNVRIYSVIITSIWQFSYTEFLKEVRGVVNLRSKLNVYYMKCNAVSKNIPARSIIGAIQWYCSFCNRSKSQLISLQITLYNRENNSEKEFQTIEQQPMSKDFSHPHPQMLRMDVYNINTRRDWVLYDVLDRVCSGSWICSLTSLEYL